MLLPVFWKALAFPTPLRLPAVLVAFMAQVTLLHLLFYGLVSVAAGLFGIDASDLLLAVLALFFLSAIGMALAATALLLVLAARAFGLDRLFDRLRATPLGRASASLALGGALNTLAAGSVSALVGPQEPQFALLAWMGAALFLGSALCAGVALRRATHR